ncbi:DUF4259 domain-containing protein [Hymenobacter cavernae]|uniref:DUF4259 domain-containing protein n=1 Tax=Hymenobacter cavernae TaxID=2044852 RepID=A0ABQ1U3Z2_9BACT|nr:DUF4259 domain-containing protein [Hymenobacter cavernae]GGF07933.1 hypothetical protein GCM10011383_18830 [Hymenobacter cavernae]
MAAWGPYNFDNDDATDFAGEFMNNGSEVLLLETLVTAADEEEFVEAEVALPALAAAEIVAAWRGHPGTDFLPGLLPVVQRLDISDEDELIELAQQAVEAVLKDSEPRNMWTENKQLDVWEAAQKDLLARLDAEPNP